MFKFKSFTKEDQTKDLNNFNPWSEKYSDDFMRYVKQEMYNFCHIWTKLMFDIYIAFLNPYNIAAIGVRDTYPTKALFGIAAFDKVYLLGFIFYCLTSKLDYKGEKYKSLFKLQQLIHLIVVISFAGGFYQSNYMNG